MKVLTRTQVSAQMPQQDPSVSPLGPDEMPRGSVRATYGKAAVLLTPSVLKQLELPVTLLSLQGSGAYALLNQGASKAERMRSVVPISLKDYNEEDDKINVYLRGTSGKTYPLYRLENYYGSGSGYDPVYVFVERDTRRRSSPRAERPSPSVSAADYTVGHRKRGNDGAMWVVKATKTGVHRWVHA